MSDVKINYGHPVEVAQLDGKPLIEQYLELRQQYDAVVKERDALNALTDLQNSNHAKLLAQRDTLKAQLVEAQKRLAVWDSFGHHERIERLERAFSYAKRCIDPNHRERFWPEIERLEQGHD